MFQFNKRKFLFKCQECEMILAVEFDEEKDIDDVAEDKMVLECPCSGKSYLLRD